MADLRATFIENGKTYGWQVAIQSYDHAMAEAATIVEKFADKERPVSDLTWKVFP